MSKNKQSQTLKQLQQLKKKLQREMGKNDKAIYKLQEQSFRLEEQANTQYYNEIEAIQQWLHKMWTPLFQLERRLEKQLNKIEYQLDALQHKEN